MTFATAGPCAAATHTVATAAETTHANLLNLQDGGRPRRPFTATGRSATDGGAAG